MRFLADASRNQNPRLYALALSLELVRTRSFQLFQKFCQGVFKLLALLVKISNFVEHGFHTRQLVCSSRLSMNLHICHSSFDDSLILCSVPSDACVRFALRILFILH